MPHNRKVKIHTTSGRVKHVDVDQALRRVKAGDIRRLGPFEYEEVQETWAWVPKMSGGFKVLQALRQRPLSET